MMTLLWSLTPWGWGRGGQFLCVTLFLKVSSMAGIDQVVDKCSDWIHMTTNHHTMKGYVHIHVVGSCASIWILVFPRVSCPTLSNSCTQRAWFSQKPKWTGKSYPLCEQQQTVKTVALISGQSVKLLSKKVYNNSYFTRSLWQYTSPCFPT